MFVIILVPVLLLVGVVFILGIPVLPIAAIAAIALAVIHAVRRHHEASNRTLHAR